MDPKLASMHGPRVLSAVLPLSRLLHYVGFSLVIGSAIAATILRAAAARTDGERRRTLEQAVAEVVTKVEVPGMAIVVLGGLLAVVANPSALDPSGGLGVWLVLKLPMVMVLAAVVFAKMFGARLLVREREQGASDVECESLVKRGMLLDRASIALAALILTITTFRFSLFG